jgi:DNA-binding NarL/FixJ family response regulator
MSFEPHQSLHVPASVVVAVRHERLRAALWALLEADADVEPLAATADVGDLATLLGRVTPAAVIIDDALLKDSGIRSLSVLGAAPGTAFVVVGMQDHPAYAARARALGAADYVRLDEADRLGRAVIETAAPFRPDRRRTGRRAVTVVPALGADSTVSRPPASSTRSRIPTRPKPSARSESSNP